MNLLIKRATIITQNKDRQIFNGDILIEGNSIKEVAAHIKNPGIDEADFNGLAVLPGFIQTHVHLCQVLFRNLADDLELLDWLQQYIWPMEMSHTPSSLRASARLGLYEMLTSGVTTILDMGSASHMDTIFEEMGKSGMRGFSGKVMMDYGSQPYRETTKEVLQSTEGLIKTWHKSETGRIQYALAPRFVLTCSDALWKSVAELAQEYDLIIHTHSSENKSELRLVKEQTGFSNVEFFIKSGLASAKLCLAHCIWVTEKEMEYLSDYTINVLHCPAANLKLGSGFAPIPAMLKKDINVSLGSDGAPCNNNLDILMDMRLAALIHKPNFGVTSITAQDVLDMATINGAKAVGLEDKIGSIEPGKFADLTILNLNKVHLSPADNVISQIVYSAQSRDVQHVMIDGEWTVQDGKPIAYEELEIIDDARRECADLLKRIKKY